MPSPPEDDIAVAALTAIRDQMRLACQAALDAGASKDAVATLVGVSPSTLDTWLQRPADHTPSPDALTEAELRAALRQTSLLGDTPSALDAWLQQLADHTPDPDALTEPELRAALGQTSAYRDRARDGADKITRHLVVLVHVASDAGWSERQIAEAAGVSRTSVRSWLADDAPNPDALTEARALTEAELRAALGQTSACRDRAREAADKVTRHLVVLIHAASDAGWSERQIAEAAGVSRTSVRSWLGRRSWNHTKAKPPEDS